MAVNLLAVLDDERYGASTLARAHDAAARAGYTLRRTDGSDALLEAWIDFHFAPSWWSFEAAAGSAWVASRDGEIVGFAAFGARGLKFPWLRAWRDRDDVGIFGPYGVAQAHRGGVIGEVLLTAALCGLRESGYAFALIPAVSGEKLIASYVRRTGASVAEEFDYDVGRFRATILASGAGTNARNVIECVRKGRLPLDVQAVIANDAHAGALDAAREHDIAAVDVVWDRAHEPRARFDARAIDAVAVYDTYYDMASLVKSIARHYAVPAPRCCSGGCICCRLRSCGGSRTRSICTRRSCRSIRRRTGWWPRTVP